MCYTITRKYNQSCGGGSTKLEAIEIARRAVEAASEKQASDIVLLDTREATSFVDYMVICSGASPKQLRAISEEIGHTLKKEGVSARHHEGTLDSGWLLIDFGDVIVHVFAPEERGFYRLEELWSRAVPLVRIQ